MHSNCSSRYTIFLRIGIISPRPIVRLLRACVIEHIACMFDYLSLSRSLFLSHFISSPKPHFPLFCVFQWIPSIAHRRSYFLIILLCLPGVRGPPYAVAIHFIHSLCLFVCDQLSTSQASLICVFPWLVALGKGQGKEEGGILTHTNRDVVFVRFLLSFLSSLYIYVYAAFEGTWPSVSCVLCLPRRVALDVHRSFCRLDGWFCPP